MNTLEKWGVCCGRLFSNIENPGQDIYNVQNYEYYNSNDIDEVFENNAYIFMQELPLAPLNFKSGKYYEGLSKFTFDRNDVFVLSPDQFLAITPNSINEPVCFIWVDNTKDNRSARYHSEHRSYNYLERDAHERRDIGSFVKTLYGFENSQIIYFNNEVPCRVAAIIYTMIKHPDTIDMFVKNFN